MPSLMGVGGVVCIHKIEITLLSQKRIGNYSAKYIVKHSTYDALGGVVSVLNYSASAINSTIYMMRRVDVDKHFRHADVRNGTSRS